jgi:glycosyltransferase involved in cell wall biosynthesis
MSEINVSIIVPVYNVAKYLRRCLDSCVAQTMREIEIIIVNDLSPDPTDSEIMREYEEKHQDKIKCIWHTENKTQGGARNTGIRMAKGEYLNFVDSDDYIEPKMCENYTTRPKQTMPITFVATIMKLDKASSNINKVILSLTTRVTRYGAGLSNVNCSLKIIWALLRTCCMAKMCR